MKVAAIDVGSNTVCLLVAAVRAGRVLPVHEERSYVGLGAEVLRYGVIGDAKLAEAAAAVRRQATVARSLGVQRVEAVVTAPAREAANGRELVEAVGRAGRVPVRPLRAAEEGLLAYEGAVAAAPAPRGLVAVSDVGGSSTEIVIGAPPASPAWIRSLDVGSLRLTARFLHDDPPTRGQLEAAAREASLAFATLVPPRPHAALAAGGTARALARLVGRELGEPELVQALRLVASRRAAKLARSFGVELDRARLLAAGTLVLLETTRRLGVPLSVAHGGLREGAAKALARELAAA